MRGTRLRYPQWTGCRIDLGHSRNSVGCARGSRWRLPMSTYILFHARWHGSWCWERVAGRLRARGHTVLTPERPSFDEAVALVRAQPEPPVLVGHSSGG